MNSVTVLRQFYLHKRGRLNRCVESGVGRLDAGFALSYMGDGVHFLFRGERNVAITEFPESRSSLANSVLRRICVIQISEKGYGDYFTNFVFQCG